MNLGDHALLPLVSRGLVILGWAWFYGFFLFRRPSTGRGETRREPVSMLGLVLQGAGFGLAWLIQRPLPGAGTPLDALEIARDVLAPVLSLASAWIGVAAVHTLGRQWSLEARLIEGHQLVTQGPYAFVRHPIYTGMLGKLLSCNLAFGAWVGLPVAGTVFVLGTLIRIRSEEKLLRGAFGPVYEDYARRVPAFVPGLH